MVCRHRQRRGSGTHSCHLDTDIHTLSPFPLQHWPQAGLREGHSTWAHLCKGNQVSVTPGCPRLGCSEGPVEAVLSDTPTDFSRATSGPVNPWACHCVTCSPRYKDWLPAGQAYLIWAVWPRGTTEARLSITGGRRSKDMGALGSQILKEKDARGACEHQRGEKRKGQGQRQGEGCHHLRQEGKCYLRQEQGQNQEQPWPPQVGGCM